MDPWSLFWRQGHSTTFGDYFKDGYVGAVADWWQSKLDQLPPAAVILEVGCGNGSLLPLLIRSGVRGSYIGVDLAAVDLSEVAKNGLAESGIEARLHSETPAEKIPEADASVDLVASVFGIEYSDFERSLPEVWRLLKPGGRFYALLHHDASVVTSMSRRAIAEFHAGDLNRALDALKSISKERDQTTSVAELKTNLRAEESRQVLNLLAEKYLSNTDPATANATMFEFMTRALQFFKIISAPSQARRQFILSLAREHQASHERFRQMVSVAFDAAGIENLQSRLIALGFAATTVNVIHNNDDILAWGLCASK
jgi:ubiquinone/menaquinone biosynthesis C-methylase UbiE